MHSFTHQETFVGCSHLETLSFADFFLVFDDKNIPFDSLLRIGSNADLELQLRYLCTLLPFSAIRTSFRKIQSKFRCDSPEADAGITAVYNYHILKGIGYSTEPR